MRTPIVSLAGGELSSDLYGRVDLQKYQTGAELLENFLVRAEGGIAKRPGLYLTGETKYLTGNVRTVEWQIATDDAYLLEIGHLYIRFIRFGALLKDGPTIVEVVTPWTEAQVRELKFTFANDVAYIFHHSTTMRELKRTSLTAFTLTEIDLTNNAPTPTLIGSRWVNVTQATPYGPAGPLNNADYDEAPRTYLHKIAAIYSDGSESPPTAATSTYADLGFHQYAVEITWDDPIPPAGVTLARIVIYKNKGGLFGFIGYADPGVLYFWDENVDPTFDTVPRRTFSGFDGNPAVGEFFKQRLAVANSTNKPQSIWLSRVGDFVDYATSLPVLADDGFNFSLDGSGQHTIHHLVAKKSLLVFTNTAEWLIDQEGEGFSIKTVSPVIQSNYGSNPYLTPLLVNERILFVQNISGSIRDFGYNLQSDSFVADDLTRLSRHLFKDSTTIAWAHADYPYDLLCTVQDSGSLNHMTYLRDDEIWAWSRTKTRGSFQAVGSVAEISENAIYLVVNRVINGTPRRFIERMQFTYGKDIRDAFYVDCGLTYDSAKTAHTFSLVDGVLYATVDGFDYTEGDRIEFSWTVDNKYYVVITTLVGGGYTPITPNEIVDIVLPDSFNASGRARKAAASLSGLDHLNGETVVALADGNVVRGLVVEDGSVTLPHPASRVHIGLPYEARFKSLDLDIDQLLGQAQIRSIPTVTVKLKDSRGVEAGMKGEELWPLKPRSGEDYSEPNAPLNGNYTITVTSNWEDGCGVEVLSTDPLPVIVQAIAPEIEYAD